MVSQRGWLLSPSQGALTRGKLCKKQEESWGGSNVRQGESLKQRADSMLQTYSRHSVPTFSHVLEPKAKALPLCYLTTHH